jgi:hypothetical protein
MLNMLQDYEALITSEHNQKPRFMATVALSVQGSVDQQALLYTFPSIFDIDVAVGEQLDMIGQWVGASRHLAKPLPPSGITVLNDADYRLLLFAIIALNYWDGTVPGMYAIWAIVFATVTFQVLIEDFQDMTMAVVLLDSSFSTVVLALLTNGYFDLRPAGVGEGFYEATGVPVFGLDIENSLIAGLDNGYMVEDLVV